MQKGVFTRCHFCKTPKSAERQVVGAIIGIQSEYTGGMHICPFCIKKFEKLEKHAKRGDYCESDGESQMYHDYGVY